MTDVNNLHQQTISDLEKRLDEARKENIDLTDRWLTACSDRDAFKETARKLMAALEVKENFDKIKEELR